MEKFIQKFNEAFAASNTGYISQNVTDDIQWTMIGDKVVRGKEAFVETLKSMVQDEPLQLTIKNTIIHGDSAAVDGTLASSDGKTYAFCDIYRFSGTSDPKIREMISYVVEMK